jgi:hypothetical protein
MNCHCARVLRGRKRSSGSRSSSTSNEKTDKIMILSIIFE